MYGWYSTFCTAISIHALLAESDYGCLHGAGLDFYFNPRSPCGERPPAPSWRWPPEQISIHALLAESDDRKSATFPGSWEFQSTLSLRRATNDVGEKLCDLRRFQSTLSLRRATRPWRLWWRDWRFQSTLSLRRATVPFFVHGVLNGISIHALLAESDIQASRS